MTEVKDLYTGVIRMIESKDVIKIDQAYLETVLPALGEEMRELTILSVLQTVIM